jgi:hypothetical protein
VLRQDKEFGLDVVDLAKDPLAAGPLARSTTRNLNLDEALGLEARHIRPCVGPPGLKTRNLFWRSLADALTLWVAMMAIRQSADLVS